MIILNYSVFKRIQVFVHSLCDLLGVVYSFDDRPCAQHHIACCEYAVAGSLAEGIRYQQSPVGDIDTCGR